MRFPERRPFCVRSTLRSPISIMHVYTRVNNTDVANMSYDYRFNPLDGYFLGKNEIIRAPFG